MLNYSIIFREIIVPLEVSFAVCLNKLFSESEPTPSIDDNKSKWKETTPKVPSFVLPAWHMNLVCTQISRTMGEHGLGKILTTELKVENIYLYIDGN